MPDNRISLKSAIPETALLLATLPLVLLHFKNLWQMRPHYQFFPFLVGGCLWLIWSRWPQWKPESRLLAFLRIGLLCAGIVALLASILLFSPTLGMAAAMLLLGAVLIRLTGSSVGALVTSWLLLWMVVPPPFRLDLRLIQSLQGVVSRASSTVFDVLGVEHVMSGNVLDLPGKRLLVEQACSGINSLLVLVCAAALFAIAARRPALRSALLISCAVGWALLVNLARVVAIGVVHATWGWDWSTGWVHDALGLVLVVIAFLLLVSTDYLLGWLLGDVGLAQAIAEGHSTRVKLLGTKLAMKTNPFSYFWDCWVGGEPPKGAQDVDSASQQVPDPGAESLPAAAGLVSTGLAITAAVVLFAAQLFLVSQPGGPRIAGNQQPLPFRRANLPEGDWAVVDYRTEQRDSNSDEGAFSSIWTVRSLQREAIVSVDYPFPGWHELSNCYIGQGWDVLSRRVRPSSEGQGGDVVEVLLSKPNGEQGCLFFSLFATDGRPLAARPNHWTSMFVRLASNPLVTWAFDGTSATLPHSESIQVQLFAPTLRPLSEPERDQYREQFLAYRTALRRSATDLVNNAPSGQADAPN